MNPDFFCLDDTPRPIPSFDEAERYRHLFIATAARLLTERDQKLMSQDPECPPGQSGYFDDADIIVTAGDYAELAMLGAELGIDISLF